MEPLQQNSALTTLLQSQVDTTRGASQASDVTAMRRPPSCRNFFPHPCPPYRHPRWGGGGQTNMDRLVDLIKSLLEALLKRTEDKQVEPKPTPTQPTPSQPTPAQPAPTEPAPSQPTPPTSGKPAETPSTGTPTTPDIKSGGCDCTCPGETGAVDKKPETPGLKHTEGFLWKPVSEKDGKLAILLPPHLTGKVKSVRILSPDGKTTIGRGSSAGVGNGDREHFRFSKPGSHFPDGCKVEITLNDGTKRLVEIPETSERYTKK